MSVRCSFLSMEVNAKSMENILKLKNLPLAISLLLVFVGVTSCNRANRAARSAETDALFRAVHAGSPDTVRAVLNSPNVDVNAADEHGNTPLIEAARYGHDQVVSVLLLAHADPTIKNDEGKTALMLAAEGRHDETVRVLTQAGVAK
ncbi:MAG: ankyrin repeat protein 6 [Acidobacteriota bacterium]